MAFAFEDLIDSLRASRSNFHKHLEGLREDYYHTGQVAFIRMASAPTWNY